MNKLKEVILNKFIAKLPTCLFDENTSLETINCQKTVTTFGDECFKNYTHLTVVNLKNVIMGCLSFSGCENSAGDIRFWKYILEAGAISFENCPRIETLEY